MAVTGTGQEVPGRLGGAEAAVRLSPRSRGGFAQQLTLGVLLLFIDLYHVFNLHAEPVRKLGYYPHCRFPDEETGPRGFLRLVLKIILTTGKSECSATCPVRNKHPCGLLLYVLKTCESIH